MQPKQRSKNQGKAVQEGDVFDLLATLGDFESFKDSILAYKREQEGRGTDLGDLLSITPA
jgi:ADP-ribosylation factor-like protein 2-binding protein